MNGEAALAVTTALANKPTIKRLELNGMYLLPYSRKFSRTINFTVFEDFVTASKLNSSKSCYSIDSYGSLVDP